MSNRVILGYMKTTIVQDLVMPVTDMSDIMWYLLIKKNLFHFTVPQKMSTSGRKI